MGRPVRHRIRAIITFIWFKLEVNKGDVFEESKMRDSFTLYDEELRGRQRAEYIFGVAADSMQRFFFKAA